jgi:hypothetical protein
MVARGVLEVAPLALTTSGTFRLVWAAAAPALPAAAATDGKAGDAAVQSQLPPTVVLPPLRDEYANLTQDLLVLEKCCADSFNENPIPTLAPPVLLCANPFVVPSRAPSSRNRVDPTTPQAARERFRNEGYELIWSDEFNGSSLDRTKWTAQNGSGPETYTGADNFWYGNIHREENVSVAGGTLRLTAKKEPKELTSEELTAIEQRPQANKMEGKYKHIQRTNGSVTSRYKADWRYCKIVVKAKVPNFPFMHHGVWTLSSENGSPPLEVDFPDAANSPVPVDGNTVQSMRTSASSEPIPFQ